MFMSVPKGHTKELLELLFLFLDFLFLSLFLVSFSSLPLRETNTTQLMAHSDLRKMNVFMQ